MIGVGVPKMKDERNFVPYTRDIVGYTISGCFGATKLHSIKTGSGIGGNCTAEPLK